MASSELLEEIVSLIKKKGPITFREFMELCLYHPRYGYYSGKRVGKEGDFYTSVSLGPLFGRVLAKQIKEMLDHLGSRRVVEVGAGWGDLARDIVSVLDGVEYVAVERMEENKVEGCIRWLTSLKDLEPFEGVIISNELFDALPVHVVEVRGGEIQEVFVDWDGGFKEVLGKPSSPDLEEYFRELGVELPEGFRTEVNLDAIGLLKAMSEKLLKGYVITIDYGYPSQELYRGYRSRGTLLCYYRHRAFDNPYVNIGEQDMTTHVNFSALMLWGERFGLKTLLFTDQLHFLLSLGIVEEAKTLQERLKAKSLIMPGGMGEIFKVLIQGKDVIPRNLLGSKFLPSWGISLV